MISSISIRRNHTFPTSISTDVITRWSSLKPAVDRILQKLNKLKKYFWICHKPKFWSGTALISFHFAFEVLAFFFKPVKHMQRKNSCIFESYLLMPELRNKLLNMNIEENNAYGLVKFNLKLNNWSWYWCGLCWCRLCWWEWRCCDMWWCNCNVIRNYDISICIDGHHR